jgi:hypothetical protein
MMDPKVLQQEIANKIKVNLFWAAFDFAFGEILQRVFRFTERCQWHQWRDR